MPRHFGRRGPRGLGSSARRRAGAARGARRSVHQVGEDERFLQQVAQGPVLRSSAVFGKRFHAMKKVGKEMKNRSPNSEDSLPVPLHRTPRDTPRRSGRPLGQAAARRRARRGLLVPRVRFGNTNERSPRYVVGHVTINRETLQGLL